MTLTRRDLLLGAAAVVVSDPTAASTQVRLLPTPRQVRGPFWPRPAIRAQRFPLEHDLDLVVVAGSPPAEGTRVHLLGDVRNVAGEPLLGAVLEVWQTCDRGRYLHPGDRREEVGTHDPGFQYFGTGPVAADGTWALRSVMPRTYPATASRRWWRPPHVHFRVLLGPRVLLTTQLYFDDPMDPANATTHGALQEVDRLLRRVPGPRRHELITRLAPAEERRDLADVLSLHGIDPAADPAGGPTARWGEFRIVVAP